jgi:2-octaprenyl-6-methoxyphenol hydroxylase
MVNSSCDIVIVGAGLVGASLALALAGTAKMHGLRMILLEAASLAQPPSTSQNELDGRATALAYGSRNLLHGINLWHSLNPYAEPILKIQVSDQGHFATSHLSATEMGSEALGYVIENRLMRNLMLQRLQQLSDWIELIDQAQVMQVDNAFCDSLVTYKRDGQTHHLSAQLIVIADGGDSKLRRYLGMYSDSQSYHQVAVVVDVVLERPHLGLACERFTRSGLLALLPLRDHTQTDTRIHRAAVVWIQPQQRAEELRQLSDRALLIELQRQAGYRLGFLQRLGGRQVYPLSLSLSREQVRQGLVVAGNAAHTLHPIAGQGFNLALRSCFALAQYVFQACEKRQNLGDLAGLNTYQHIMQRDQRRIVGLSDGVMRMFSNNKPHLSLLRQAGLLALEQTPWAKQIFIRGAMGMDMPIVRLPPLPTIASHR